MDGRSKILLSQAVSRWRWTRGYVDDVARGIFLAVKNGQSAGHVYNIGERDALTEEDWACAIGEAADWHGKLVIVPDEAVPEHLKMPYDFSHNLWAETALVRDELGYGEEITRQEALKRTIEWERANPPEFDPSRFDYVAEDAALARL